uniref:Transmembrane protein 164 n=1 Tax=Eptatretus burgeri TaxID=7764 RepID=A0A8C4QEL9_EPTBU
MDGSCGTRCSADPNVRSSVASAPASCLEHFLDLAYGGVDHTLPGNGGAPCVAFLSLGQRAAESVLMVGVSLIEMWFAWKGLRGQLANLVPRTTSSVAPVGEPKVVRTLLLCLLSLTFGMEMGYKFSTRTLIYLLNPCHVVTVMQIVVLVLPQCRAALILFRLQLHMLNGALLALLFPILNTRLLPCETKVYYIQHVLLYLVPLYLLRNEGFYQAEPLGDWSWGLLATGLLFLYHFTVLQGLGLLTQVNLNNMICPAISDPFYSRWYRLWASGHQTALIMLHGKLLTIVSRLRAPSHLLRPKLN